MARAGRLVRFVPFPVIAGFLGASGWFLLVGGVRVATEAPDMAALLDASRHAPLLAALAGGVLLLAAPGRRVAGPFGLPLLILGCILLHHAVAIWLGADLAAQVAAGWLPPAPERLAVSLPWDPATLALVDWWAIGRHLPDLPLLILVATIGLLMNVSGVEAATGRDAEIDRELRVAGGAALATGLAGGLFGLIFARPQPAAVGRRAEPLGGRRGQPAGRRPAAGLPEALGLIPRWVLGAVLVFLGLDLLRHWILRSRRDLPISEWLQVVAVAAATVGFDFLIGLLAGVLLACGHFVALYGRASPIRTRYDGTAVGGNWARPEHDRAALRATGTARLILHLQGFLFSVPPTACWSRCGRRWAGRMRRRICCWTSGR